MIRPPFILSHLPFPELVEDIQLLINHDREMLEKQTARYHYMIQEGRRTANYLQRYKERLEHAQTRLEFVSSLISRLQTYDFRYLVKALEEAKENAKQEGRTGQYAFALMFHPEEKPRIIQY